MMGFRYLLFTILLFGLTACFEAAQVQRGVSQTDETINGNATDVDGDGIIGSDENVGADDELTVAKVEIRHLIEPKVDDDSDAGDYKRKLTIPKNYNGLLYIAGINISTLNSQSVSVRFKFGVDSLPITIPATVSTAKGLTPQTDVEVLVLDMRNKQFENINLLYDLYDYNDYDLTGADTSLLNEPVSHNRNDNLFCRGLKISDDSTFTGDVNDGCNAQTEVCKYAYAKVVDKGLVDITANLADPNDPPIPLVPSEPNIQSGSLGYYQDTNAVKLNRCLADNPLIDLTKPAHIFNLTGPEIIFPSYNFEAQIDGVANQAIDGKRYKYLGPYRALNQQSWQISSDAVKGQYGIYTDYLSGTDLDSGYGSKLFPLYTKFDLSVGTEYLGSALPDQYKEPYTMTSNTQSEWLDGCNERATSVNQFTGEHIGSCNVTASIEIIATDDDGNETVIDATKEVKLQLVKPVVLNTQGENVLLSSFSQCSSSSQCGADECCINKHCWSKSIVNQCIEDLPSYGNQVTGELCTSDYQCASLCCNKIDGRCAPHDTISDNPSFCSKPAQQSCVAKEWCQKHPVRTCAIVSTGTDPQGGLTCALRCVTAEVFGDCTSPDGVSQGVCVPPPQPDPVVFNPNDPNRCANAITFNELVECANNPGTCTLQ